MGNFLPSTDAQRRDMMNAVGVRNIEELYADIPADLRMQAADAVAAMPSGVSEFEALEQMKQLNDHGARVMQRHGVTGATDITGFGLLGHALSMAQSVPVAGAVVVTMPQGVSVSDVRKAVAMFRQLNIPLLGVVENMSYFVCGHCSERTEIFGHGGGARMAEELGLTFLGEVPIDTRVRSGGDEGQPIVMANPEAPAAQGFQQVAGKIAAQVSIQALRIPLRVIQAD